MTLHAGGGKEIFIAVGLGDLRGMKAPRWGSHSRSTLWTRRGLRSPPADACTAAATARSPSCTGARQQSASGRGGGTGGGAHARQIGGLLGRLPDG